MTEPSRDYVKTAIPTGLPGPGIHVLDRLLTATEKQVNLGRYETHTVASQNNWRVPESLEKVIQVPRSLHPPFTMVAEGRECSYRPTITPN